MVKFKKIKTNERKIYTSVLGVFVGIFGLIYLISDSDFYIKKIYFEFKKIEFQTVIEIKVDEHPVRHNPIYLKNKKQFRIPRKIFDNVKIGDSIIKKADSDSLIFIMDRNMIFLDYNKFNREKYLKTIQHKK